MHSAAKGGNDRVVLVLFHTNNAALVVVAYALPSIRIIRFFLS